MQHENVIVFQGKESTVSKVNNRTMEALPAIVVNNKTTKNRSSFFVLLSLTVGWKIFIDLLARNLSVHYIIFF